MKYESHKRPCAVFDYVMLKGFYQLTRLKNKK